MECLSDIIIGVGVVGKLGSECLSIYMLHLRGPEMDSLLALTAGARLSESTGDSDNRTT